MFKKLVIIFCLLCSVSGFAQVKKFWIGDTAHIFIAVDTTQMMDTLINLKNYWSYTKGEVIITYWDKGMRHREHTAIIGTRKTSDTTFYRNGRPDMIYYFDSVKGDSYASWFPDGVKKIESIFEKNGRMDMYYYHDEHLRLKQFCTKVPGDKGAYANLMYYEQWCDNGTLIAADSIGSIRMRKVVRHYCNGKKSKEYNQYQYYLVGSYKEWYDNGNIKVEGQYNDIQKDTAQSISSINQLKEQGLWKYYDENGKLIKAVTYKDGEIIETKGE
jgi:antitoxin component YwqK of YwqJK toxin-antitoxin module